MLKRLVRTSAILIVGLMVAHCGWLFGDQAGSHRPVVDETETVVLGLIVSDSIQPIQGAVVNLWNQDEIAITQSVSEARPLAKTPSIAVLEASLTATTNVNGLYRIDSVPAGMYFLEVNDHDSLGALVNLDLSAPDSITKVDVTLSRMGAVSLHLTDSLLDINGSVFIAELNRWIPINELNFQEIILPSGDYQIIIVKEVSGASIPLDTIRITIPPGMLVVSTPDTTITKPYKATGGAILTPTIEESPE